MKTKFTNRGFSYKEFKDCHGNKCSIQKSSCADEDRIWFGANDIGLQHFKAFKGWEKVELVNSEFESYIANNRIELNRYQVKKLIPILQKFVETGNIS